MKKFSQFQSWKKLNSFLINYNSIQGEYRFRNRALAKIYYTVIVVIVIVSVTVGIIGYFILQGQNQTSETIKIGVFADLDSRIGSGILQGVELAAEELNNEGGVLGKQIEVVGEDNDVDTSVDTAIFNSALTRLLTYHKVDFVIGISGPEGYLVQDSIADHKKIYFEIGSSEDMYTQRVLEDYNRYKYYFRLMYNTTSISQSLPDSLVHLREVTGFNRVGYIGEPTVWKGVMDGLDQVLPEVYGFDLVYKGEFPLGTVDFSSYFAAAEAAEVEIMIPFIIFDEAIPFVKEYSNRQSPMVIYSGALGGGVGGPDGWAITDGKCEYITGSSNVVIAGYPLTNKTLLTREALIERYNEITRGNEVIAYDILRYILPDAIRRADTLEVNEIIEALESTSIETSMARNFVFTSSHDLMVGENINNPDADYWIIIFFQWQNGKQVPVYPKKIMEEAGATYTYPDWPGPWDDIS